MAGLGSPCGACKFLRRKCASGCVFAPYFHHQHGAAHFAAIHKVFGASNVAKLLMHLPMADRPEAAVTISYEAQARLQNPIYGCVAHIFALQQQVSNLVLASLEAQAARRRGNGTASGTIRQEEDMLCNTGPPHRQDLQGFFIDQAGSRKTPPQFASTLSMDVNCYPNSLWSFEENAPPTNFDMADEDFSFEAFSLTSCFDTEDEFWRSAFHYGNGDLQPAASTGVGRS
ncbi:hypothetical protein BHE74_00004343 [Ensete ventricosum]|uniref:Uncharacterized protein n=1 Tax=Ensete ventricosum TaxID=4639 RepID=A0A444FPB3_ENSVE|nr:hypothetical protein B296_00038669 [Ensete ventricosum]RWW24480.1 hypothetical protein GW17_00011225 [Ensete ventricosum]RWW86866.1 hypothetical protein BHE74_00004343 [Ensete ventricosum]RZS16487.1 hypothetical protein BHM03_00048474 [Ensete ventricosum]